MKKKDDMTYAQENTAQKKIMEYLNSLDNCSFDKKQSSKYGNANGFSDIVGVCNGKAVYIEIKSNSGTPSGLQIEFLKKKKACGAYGGFARSISDAIDIIHGGFGLEFPKKGWQQLKKREKNDYRKI